MLALQLFSKYFAHRMKYGLGVVLVLLLFAAGESTAQAADCSRFDSMQSFSGSFTLRGDFDGMTDTDTHYAKHNTISGTVTMRRQPLSWTWSGPMSGHVHIFEESFDTWLNKRMMTIEGDGTITNGALAGLPLDYSVELRLDPQSCQYTVNASSTAIIVQMTWDDGHVTSGPYATGAWSLECNSGYLGICGTAPGSGTVLSGNLTTVTLGIPIVWKATWSLEPTACTYTITPLMSTHFTSPGGVGTATVTASDESCPWNAASSVPWLHITYGASGIGLGGIMYTVDANSGPARNGQIVISSQVSGPPLSALAVTEDGAAGVCSYNLSASSASFTAPASSGSVGVIAPPFCTWAATSSAPWLTITSGVSGTSNGTVNYSVGANTSGIQRIGTLTVAGLTFTVTQETGCSYSLSASSASFSAAGGSGSVGVIAPSLCTWTATSNAAWLTITSGGSGTSGNGTVNYSASANTSGIQRIGTLTTAGLAFTATQDPATNIVQYPLTIQVSFGGSGSTSTTLYNAGQAVTLSATAAAGFVFSSWTGSGTGSYSGSNNPVTITMNGPITETSSFQTGITSAGALRFVPVPPCRAVDTRNPSGPLGGPRMAAGQVRAFPIPASACNIPPNAAAYSLNVTVVPVGVLGFLTLWPAGESQPMVSTLNSVDGRIKANAAIVPSGGVQREGGVNVYVTDAADVILDINGYFVPVSAGSNLAFYPVTPCRVADTRNPALPGGPMNGGQSRTFAVRGTCGLPASAKAYSLNFTVVPSGPLSFLTTWPSGEGQPLVSTLNAPTGTVVANAALVPAGANGSVDVYVTNPTDVIIDVNGYFALPAQGGMSFYSAAPCRLADTRNPAGAFGGTTITAGETRILAVLSGVCGIPATAQAYSLNATVVPAGVLGYLTLWASGATMPVVSTLNSLDRSVTSNAAIVPAGTSGSIGAYVTDRTDLILDISGYFAP